MFLCPASLGFPPAIIKAGYLHISQQQFSFLASFHIQVTVPPDVESTWSPLFCSSWIAVAAACRHRAQQALGCDPVYFLVSILFLGYEGFYLVSEPSCVILVFFLLSSITAIFFFCGGGGKEGGKGMLQNLLSPLEILTP
jgi:hypothetical protein